MSDSSEGTVVFLHREKHEETNHSEAGEILKSIKALQASGIDGILPLGDLISRCRNSNHPIGEYEEKTLIGYNLMRPDGEVSDAVRDVVLSGSTGGKFFD